MEKQKKINFIYSTSDKRRGVRGAMLESFKIASGDYIFFADSGKKFDFNDFWKLYGLKEKYDLVSALRTSRQDQFYRIFLTKGGKLQVKFGSPSENPKKPVPVDDALEIATVGLPAFLYPPKDSIY